MTLDEMYAVEVRPDVQLVSLLTRPIGNVPVHLTLAESEALIKRLGEENAKLRAVIARDGDVAEAK